MSRKRLTIPNPVRSGYDLDVKITDDRWVQLENELGKCISLELRAHIIDATNRFLRHAVSETESPSSKPAKARLHRITRATKRLSDAIKDDRGTYDAIKYANSLIDKHLSGLEDHQDIYDLVNILVLACSKANAEFELDKNAAPLPVQYWNNWIRSVTDLLRRNDLPTSARKDAALQKADQQPSAFVRFIEQLQKEIPEAHRQAEQSKDALAGAITKARRAGR
jgi:hypothetical protein